MINLQKKKNGKSLIFIFWNSGNFVDKSDSDSEGQWLSGNNVAKSDTKIFNNYAWQLRNEMKTFVYGTSNEATDSFLLKWKEKLKVRVR